MASEKDSEKKNNCECWLKGGEVDNKALKREAETCFKLIKCDGVEKQKEGLTKLHDLISHSWSLEDTRLARDASDFICELTRTSNTLDLMLSLAVSPQKTEEEANEEEELRLKSLAAIEQIMVAENRQYIAQHCLFPSLINFASLSTSVDRMRCGTGIFENLFKVSPSISLKLIGSGGLQTVMLCCRENDNSVTQHCAAALANCALYGCPEVHREMISKSADHWLFPLAFSQDSAVKYYALIAICLLASDPQLLPLVKRSGTLELVIPFLRLQDPLEFPKTCPNHAHGRDASWLERVVPLLSCSSGEAQSLAAFHFAMEAGIKQKQNRLKVFSEIKVHQPLFKAAQNGTQLTSQFSCQALRTMGLTLPSYYCWNCVHWSPDQVSSWVTDIGLPRMSPLFRESFVSGDILLDVTLTELQSLGCKNSLVSKWLLKQIKVLRCKVDFSDSDPEHICDWLVSISPELALYKANFMSSGVTREILPLVNEDVLREMGVSNPIHRLKLGVAIDNLALTGGHDSPDFESPLRSLNPNLSKKYDVFISYRRSSGSQLASLLKVHLQLKGLNVFLDVAALGSGKFDEALLTTIANSLNMVIVLTHNALDRCLGDFRTQDWVHREIVHALDSNIHMVPVLDNFQWPNEDLLPSDIRTLSSMNGVKWSHEYQEACVEKLISFLTLPAFRRKSGSVYSKQDSVIEK